MSSIHKLSIRGIRSFSHEREQAIEFYSPLTMILGANGCGKTTIIECLKYACTGSLPPNSGKGQYFVHDPKVSGTSEVKASIKLRFSGRDAKVSVVVRSFQLTQKRLTLQFKALDGVIRTKDENGMSVSITHKCTELESHIPFRLGVSKAILEHVVFCHQEDSSWPLQDSRSVKTKFDDIFESARYTKALDEIKSTKKEYDKTVKNLQVDLAGLHERLRAAEGLKAELEESKEHYGRLRKEVEDVDARTAELKDNLGKLREVVEQVYVLEAQKQSLELTCRDLDVRMGEKRDNIGDAWSNDSDEVLEENLREFDEKYQKLAYEIHFYKNQAEEYSRQAHEAKRNKGVLQGEEGRLQAQLQHQEKVIADRDRLMELLAQRYQIFDIIPSAGGSIEGDAGAVGRYTSGDVASFDKALQHAVAKANAALSEARNKSRIEVDAMTSELNKLQLEQRSSEDAVRAKTTELRKIQYEVTSLTQNTGGRGGGGGGAGSQSQLGFTVSKLERELKQAEQNAASTQTAFDEFKSETSIAKITDEIRTLDAQIADMKAKLEEAVYKEQELSEQQGLQSARATKVIQIDDEEANLVLAYTESATFKRNLPWTLTEFTGTELSKAVEEIRSMRLEKEGERASKERELIDLRRNKTEKETILRQSVGELSMVKKKLDQLSALSMEVVRGVTNDIANEPKEDDPKAKDPPQLDPTKDLDKALKYLQEKMAKQEKTLGNMKINYKFSSKLLKAIQSKDEDKKNVCPSCLRHMNAEEVQRFNCLHEKTVILLKDPQKQAIMRQEIRGTTATIKRLEDNAEGWREWVRLSSRPAELEEAKVKIERELTSLRGSLEAGQQQTNELREQREILDAALSEATVFLNDANRIDDYRREVVGMDEKLERRYGGDITLAQAQQNVKKLREDRDKAMLDVQAKNQNLRRVTQTQLKLNNNLNAAMGELKEAMTKLEKKKEFDMKREALRERERVLESELTEAKTKEQPLRQRMQEKNNQLIRVRDQARAATDQLQAAAQDCQTDARRFYSAKNDVEGDMAKKLPEALVGVKRKLEEAEAEILRKENDADSTRDTMNGKIITSNKQSQGKKLLKDNMDYRGLQRELKERKADITGVEVEIAKVDSKDVRGQISSLNREMQRKTQARAELKGRLYGLKDQVRGFETKLQTDPYKHIEEKHRRKMIEHRTTEMAVSDLDKYWTALDKALLRFHTMKIADINQIIRELWAMTYSGQDIDMIEIVSGDEGEETNRARRSYNYRVVMRKNDATLDMKGRCSAGQRVLASIVIRLALAETFSVSCGILALDEPTTNLDSENKIGLARALAKIISNRSRQSNFQLITITHDEEFVKTMRVELSTQAGISMPEYGYRISREEMARGKFYSRIDRNHWEDM